MRIFNSVHQNPLTIKQIIVDAKEIRLVLFCEACRKPLTTRIENAKE